MRWPWKRPKLSLEAAFTRALAEAQMSSVRYLSSCDRCGVRVVTVGRERPAEDPRLCEPCDRELKIRAYDKEHQ